MPGVPCFLLLLLLLAMSAPSHAWSRPLWYQVGLDLQPWGCQPNSLEGCGASLGCSSHWTGLGMNPLYPVAGVTLTTTMMLVLSRKVLQRRRSQGGKSEVSAAPRGPRSLLPPHSSSGLISFSQPTRTAHPPSCPRLLLPHPHHSHPEGRTYAHTHHPPAGCRTPGPTPCPFCLPGTPAPHPAPTGPTPL